MRIATGGGSVPFHLTCPAPAPAAVSSVADATACNTLKPRFNCSPHVVMRVAERLWQSFVPGCMCYHFVRNVCFCVGVHAEADCCRPVSLHASCVCFYTFPCAHVYMSVCVCVRSWIQYVCSPAHGLQSKRKAQERQAAGVEFGAVSCWMLCKELKKADSRAGVTFTGVVHRHSRKQSFVTECSSQFVIAREIFSDKLAYD